MGLCSCSRPPRAAAASQPPASKWVRFVLFFFWVGHFPFFSPTLTHHFISFYSFPSHIIRHVRLPRGMSHSTGVGCAGGSKVHGGASAWQLSNLSYLHLNFFPSLELFSDTLVESRNRRVESYHKHV